MPTPFKLNTSNINKLAEIGIKPESTKIIETLLKDKIPLNRTNLENSGVPTDEINKMMAKVISDDKEDVPEIKSGKIIVRNIENKAGFSIVLRFNTIQSKNGKNVTISNENRFNIYNGIANIDWDNKATKFKLLIKRPSGDFIKIKSGTKEGIEIEIDKPDELLDKTVEVLESTELVITDIKPIIVSRLKGRLLSKNSSRKLDKIQIVIQAALNDNPTDDDFFTVCYAVTEQDGYFFTSQLDIASKDRNKIKVARAQIALPNRIVPIPKNIRLIEQDDNGRKYHTFPEKIILFIDDEEVKDNESKNDCDCDCTDLDFHDKKSLEEFSFYTVVRTTEPLIEAYEISDVKKIDLKEIVTDQELKGLLGGYELSATTIKDFITKNGPITKLNASNLLNTAKRDQQIENILRETKARELRYLSGRIDLDGTNDVDWDDKPTIYQATSIAHGHLLNFKQEWFNDGYSIGDLIYSLPLAPGQKKQIVTFDWDRKDSASNIQQIDYQDSLYNSLSRDRDVNEVAKGVLNEHSDGGSISFAGGYGAGGGLGAIAPTPVPIGALVGAGGGLGNGGSFASQSSSRATTASSQQSISDRTVQSASSIRSQRSTVIQTVSQGERFQVSAEVIANYNHCHAMTVQYFEVLRHFEIRTRLAGVQECLFIPLKVKPFDRKKALRWRDILSKCLKKKFLVAGFDSLERYDDAVDICGEGNSECIDKHYDTLGIPDNRYAEESLQYIEGELYLEFQIKMPQILPDIAETLKTTGWAAFGGIIGEGPLQSIFENQIKNELKKDEAFANYIGPRIADSIINGLNFFAVKNRIGTPNVILPIDATLLSNFKNRTKLNVSLRMKDAFNSTLKREDIDFIKITFGDSETPNLLSNLATLIGGDYLRIIVHSGSMRYRTQNLHEHLFQNSRIKNDLTISDGVNIFTPLSEKALKRPRFEDVELINSLLHHLNQNVEYYHQCIWTRMDAQRRFMLLDGLIAPGKGKGRSVASVVENKLVGIVGNCLVMPVAPGFQLDPTLDDSINLFEHYYEDPKDPVRVSLPTKGVFAEAVMGKCNSCEKKDESRFWRWEESPIPDSPTTINPLSLPTPQNIQPNNLQPKDFPAPIINLQNSPALPDPQGFGSLVNLLSNPNIFRDFTGLTENQKNAIAALQGAFGTAQFFGGKAADLTGHASELFSKNQAFEAKHKALEQIKKAKENGLITEKQAQDLTQETFKSLLGNSGSSLSQSVDDIAKTEKRVKDGEITQQDGDEIKQIIKEKEKATIENEKSTLEYPEIKAAMKESSEISYKRPDGEETKIIPRGAKYFKIEHDVPLIPQLTGMSCWAAGAAMLVAWRDSISIDPSQIAKDIEYFLQYAEGLQAEDTTMFDHWGLIPENPKTYTPLGLKDLIDEYGPLWVASAEPGPHIRVVTGIEGDGTPDKTFLFINDPWQKGMKAFSLPNIGSTYKESFRQFEIKQTSLAREESRLKGFYIAHLPKF